MQGRRLFVAAVAAAVALLAVGVTASSGSVPGGQSFPDSTADNGNGADITNVTVSNDGAGLITFRVEVPNRQMIGSSEIFIGLDTDSNPSTGRTDWGGLEYGIDLSNNLGGALGKWNGSQWDWGAPQSTFGYSYAAGVATFMVNASELGNTKSFRLYLAAGEGDAWDTAPDNGEYVYTLQAAPVTKTTAQAPAKAAAPKSAPKSVPKKKRKK